MGCLRWRLNLWSGRRDSNPRPSAWEANALPTELLSLGSIIARGADAGQAGRRPAFALGDGYW